MLFFKRTPGARRSVPAPKACLRVEQLESRLVLSLSPSSHALCVNLTAPGHAQTSSFAAHAQALVGQGGYVIGWSSNGQHGAVRGSGPLHHPAGGIASGNAPQANSSAIGNQVTSGAAHESGGGFGVTWSSNG
jgi:hypothetical protein